MAKIHCLGQITYQGLQTVRDIVTLDYSADFKSIETEYVLFRECSKFLAQLMLDFYMVDFRMSAKTKQCIQGTLLMICQNYQIFKSRQAEKKNVASPKQLNRSYSLIFQYYQDILGSGDGLCK